MPTTITGTDGVSKVQAGSIQSDDLAAGAITIGSGDLPAGSVIQVVQSVSNTSTIIGGSGTISSDATPSVSITPLSSSNKIIIYHTAGGMVEKAVQSVGLALKRDGSFIWSASRYGFTENADWTPVPFHIAYIDSPNTTSEVTYTPHIAKSLTGFVRHNNIDDTTSIAGGGQDAITIAMEIAG